MPKDGCVQEAGASMKVKDITLQKFGRLLALRYVGNDKYGNALWECRCECGAVKVFVGHTMRAGKTQSCGCLERDHPNSRTHGQTGTPAHRSYVAAKARCSNPSRHAWEHYGGRGIRFCFTSFDEFYRELGPRPEGMTLDRINQDGNYESGNVRWSTWSEQARNRRSNRVLTVNGESKCLAGWAEHLGIRRDSLEKRLQCWPLEKALTQPRRAW